MAVLVCFVFDTRLCRSLKSYTDGVADYLQRRVPRCRSTADLSVLRLGYINPSDLLLFDFSFCTLLFQRILAIKNWSPNVKCLVPACCSIKKSQQGNGWTKTQEDRPEITALFPFMLKRSYVLKVSSGIGADSAVTRHLQWHTFIPMGWKLRGPICKHWIRYITLQFLYTLLF